VEKKTVFKEADALARRLARMEQALMLRLQKAREEYAGKRDELFACYSPEVQSLVNRALQDSARVKAEDMVPESD
jgi:hypothetical protein